MDTWALIARVVVTFTQFFVGVGYLLWALGRFGAVLTALPFVEGLLLLMVGALGCFFIVGRLGRWLASFEAQRQARGKAA